MKDVCPVLHLQCSVVIGHNILDTQCEYAGCLSSSASAILKKERHSNFLSFSPKILWKILFCQNSFQAIKTKKKVPFSAKLEGAGPLKKESFFAVSLSE